MDYFISLCYNLRVASSSSCHFLKPSILPYPYSPSPLPPWCVDPARSGEEQPDPALLPASGSAAAPGLVTSTAEQVAPICVPRTSVYIYLMFYVRLHS